MINGLDHIAVTVSDIDQALSFYVDVLGFVERQRVFRAERNSLKVDLRHACGLMLEIYMFPDAPGRRADARGLRHLAFEVEDINATVKRLSGCGIAVEPVRMDRLTGSLVTLAHDPDGLPVEFYQR